jgi:hypothetical protein
MFSSSPGTEEVVLAILFLPPFSRQERLACCKSHVVWARAEPEQNFRQSPADWVHTECVLGVAHLYQVYTRVYQHTNIGAPVLEYWAVPYSSV